MSYELAQRGIVIVSGLALGIDGIAHQAALDAGGTTTAILPTSLEAIYPYSHRSLAERIVQAGGVLITEYRAGERAASPQLNIFWKKLAWHLISPPSYLWHTLMRNNPS